MPSIDIDCKNNAFIKDADEMGTVTASINNIIKKPSYGVSSDFPVGNNKQIGNNKQTYDKTDNKKNVNSKNEEHKKIFSFALALIEEEKKNQ